MTEASVYTYMTLTAMSARATNRCAALAAKGLVAGATTAEQTTDALAKLHACGYTADNDTMHHASYGPGNAAIISAMYTTAFARASLTDNLCSTNFAQAGATGDVTPIVPNTKAASFVLANGTANGTPASMIYNDSVGGAKSRSIGVSPSSGTANLSLDAALCQRALITGVDPASGAALAAGRTPALAQSQAVRAGLAEVLLRGKPTLIVAGRSDALVPVNNSARAYTACDRVIEGASSQLSCVEVSNAQHFDAFLPFPGFDSRFVPLHACYTQAMNAMYAKLTTKSALPGIRVVRTTARGGNPGAAPALTALNVPPISATPTAADAIGFTGSAINVPRNKQGRAADRPTLPPGCVNLRIRSGRLNASS